MYRYVRSSTSFTKDEIRSAFVNGNVEVIKQLDDNDMNLIVESLSELSKSEADTFVESRDRMSEYRNIAWDEYKDKLNDYITSKLLPKVNSVARQHSGGIDVFAESLYKALDITVYFTADNVKLSVLYSNIFTNKPGLYYFSNVSHLVNTTDRAKLDERLETFIKLTGKTRKEFRSIVVDVANHLEPLVSELIEVKNTLSGMSEDAQRVVDMYYSIPVSKLTTSHSTSPAVKKVLSQFVRKMKNSDAQDMGYDNLREFADELYNDMYSYRSDVDFDVLYVPRSNKYGDRLNDFGYDLLAESTSDEDFQYVAIMNGWAEYVNLLSFITKKEASKLGVDVDQYDDSTWYEE